MYGDCQVLSSLAGNGVASPDSFFPPLQIGQNPSFGFMSGLSGPFSVFHPIIPKEEGGLVMKGKEEVESGSVSEQIEGMSGNEQDGDERLPPPPGEEQPPSKKQRYHRHTAHQIQEMEALFKENPHPDDKARQKLSQELGLKPRQVKFWFQNRRTQMKAHQDRSDNAVLRVENEGLKNDNYRLQAALRNLVCTNCGGPAWLAAAELNYDDHHLRLENARLKEEYDRMCCLLSQYTGRQVQPIMPPSPHLFPSTLELDPSGPFPRKYEEVGPGPFTVEGLPFSSCPLVLDDEKSLAMELAVSCVDELVRMCHAGKPLWARGGDDGGREVLNGDEYARLFPWPLGSCRSRPSGVGFEATRASAVVIMNSITLVDAFLDAGKWMELFPSIVARAKTIQVVVPGVSGHATGSLHLMYGEFQALTPLLPTRETYFLRYCEHNAEEGTWAVVDFPPDGLHLNFPPSFPYYKRRPSGCIIQDMPNGYSRVTWIEHAEIEGDTVGTNQIFRDLVTSGEAFGARRWLAVLQRQCERVASLMARNLSDLGVIPSPEARKNMMNLAQRMIKTFCVNISTSFGQSWTSISAESAEDTVRITTRKVTEPGHPVGLVLSAVSTTWLPYHHSHVFDLLRDERHRSQLDALSNGNSLHEVAHIANGSHPGNSISLLRINVASNSSQGVELMLQESCTDDSGSLVVYATMDVEAVQLAMTGGDPSAVPLLPLGFVITPMRTRTGTDESSCDGCLLTVALQVLASSIPTAKLSLSSVTAINDHLCSTVQQINAALSSASEPLAVGPPPPVKLSKDASTPGS
ncbi:unnamed protein product [Cuscuta campestris]|uniref:Homeobox domain-containing protein n=1 Tax=Cuscuta campestris TaxID=132261 RepID=A0A484KL20_9ASTE|nr:unnamed protein product [Cuscuta campestris]